MVVILCAVVSGRIDVVRGLQLGHGLVRHRRVIKAGAVKLMWLVRHLPSIVEDVGEEVEAHWLGSFACCREVDAPALVGGLQRRGHQLENM